MPVFAAVCLIVILLLGAFLGVWGFIGLSRGRKYGIFRKDGILMDQLADPRLPRPTDHDRGDREP